MIIRLHNFTDAFPDNLVFVLYSITESHTEQIHPGDDEPSSFQSVSYLLRHDFVNELGLDDTHYIETAVPKTCDFPLQTKFIFKHANYLAEKSPNKDSQVVRYAYIEPYV